MTALQLLLFATSDTLNTYSYLTLQKPEALNVMEEIMSSGVQAQPHLELRGCRLSGNRGASSY